jgi:hydroxymethylpyrimidine/phosphomethylpyrimidine kinase
MTVAAAKTGMLANRGIIEAVAGAAAAWTIPFLVVDPVMVAKGGDRLLDRDAEQAYVERLFPLATVLTPNLSETEALLQRPVRSLDDMKAAARELHRRGVRAVVVKGGHLPGDAVDVFFDGSRMEELHAERIETANTHGTGCTYASAIASRLAHGDELLDAVRGAKAYLTEAIRRSYSVGHGHGPVDHLHPLTKA